MHHLVDPVDPTGPANRAVDPEAEPTRRYRPLPGLLIAGLGVAAASVATAFVSQLPVIVAAVLVGMLIGNTRALAPLAAPGLRIAATTVLRFGIVLLGLRLSLGDVAALGWTTLAVLIITVSGTFFGVQWIGARLGLSRRLSLLVASGFSICGNSAVAAVAGALDDPNGRDEADDEVAAAVGLVTLCGTLAIVAVPAVGGLIGLDDTALGIWTGASVQDTAQVIAVAAAAGPSVLAIATAVKLTRVLFLAPIVAGLSVRASRRGGAVGGARPPLVPAFVIGFVAALLLSSAGVAPAALHGLGNRASGLALAAGMVGLGSTVRLAGLRRLGLAPLMLGALAWLTVAAVSLAATVLLAA